MTIEIHQPELEAMIQQRMASGAFQDVDELLTKALGSLEKQIPLPPVPLDGKTLLKMFEPIQGLLTDEEWIFCSAVTPLSDVRSIS